MTWRKLPKGGFTGIDWAKPGATDGFDPYLIWAEADNFAGYGDKQPKWLPIALELTSGTSIAQLIAAASNKWLHVPPVYASNALPSGFRFCTARVKPAFFKHIQPGGNLHALIERLELGLPAGTHTEDLSIPKTQASPASEPLLKGKVIGLIDDGLAFASANFLRAGKARTKYFWRQDGKGVGNTPTNLGYGHEIKAPAIDKAMIRHTYNGLVDESLVYREFGLFGLEKTVSHGTHVLDLACGPRTLLAQVGNLPPSYEDPPSWAMANDDASQCNIVAVQVDHDTVIDTSGGSMNVHVLDGLMYILSRCASDTKIVVNLSVGTLAGPHDGSSLLEAAMDQLITLCGKRLHIVLAAGNSYQSRMHANLTLSKNEHATLDWQGQPGDSTQNFLELWLPAGAEGIRIEITPPNRAALPELEFGESRMWLDSGTQPLCALIYPKAVATGRHGTCALIALAPTFSFKTDIATAPSGLWKIKLTNTKMGAVTVDAYIERDDVIPGTKSGARQSYFEDTLYNLDAFVDDPGNPTLIRRSGSFNSIATGKNTVSVGGVRINDGTWAHYSPQKPDPDQARPQRPEVVKVPRARAASDENPALTGVRAAGTRSGAVVRLRGTSDAAPQEARRIFNAI